MGQLVDGVWQDVWYDTKSTGGRSKRSVSAFRNWLTADGAPGPSGEGALRPRKTVIISTFHSPARGRTAR
jgi:putative glutathione S-transferase